MFMVRTFDGMADVSEMTRGVARPVSILTGVCTWFADQMLDISEDAAETQSLVFSVMQHMLVPVHMSVRTLVFLCLVFVVFVSGAGVLNPAKSHAGLHDVSRRQKCSATCTSP